MGAYRTIITFDDGATLTSFVVLSESTENGQTDSLRSLYDGAKTSHKVRLASFSEINISLSSRVHSALFNVVAQNDQNSIPGTIVQCPRVSHNATFDASIEESPVREPLLSASFSQKIEHVLFAESTV